MIMNEMPKRDLTKEIARRYTRCDSVTFVYLFDVRFLTINLLTP